MKKMIFRFFNAYTLQQILYEERKFSLKFIMETGNTPTKYLIFIIIYSQAMLIFTNSRHLLCSAEGISFKLSKTDY